MRYHQLHLKQEGKPAIKRWVRGKRGGGLIVEVLHARVHRYRDYLRREEPQCTSLTSVDRILSLLEEQRDTCHSEQPQQNPLAMLNAVNRDVLGIASHRRFYFLQQRAVQS